MASYSASAATTSGAQLVGSHIRVRGWGARECASPAAPASFVLRDGFGPTAPGVLFVELDSNQSVFVMLSEADDEPIEFLHGIYVDRVTGTSELAVYQ